ncbi:MAG: magnesium transporter CorA family protein [FCB group bacterium]|jgi:magnesium transporter|nr:magnesium transporter CorA family protein [FCB group bacterium]
MQKHYTISGNCLVEGDGEESTVTLYIAPNEAERRYLVEVLQIDEHTLNSALDPDEQPRLEFEPNHVAIIYKRPRNYSAEEEFLFKVASVGMFLFKDRLILVASENDGIFEARPMTKVKSLTHVMLKLIFFSISHFLGHLKVIQMISDELEHKINAGMDNRYLLNLFTLEKSLVYYLNALNSNGLLIERLRNTSAKVGIGGEELEYLDDILIENNQCYKQAEIYSNVLSGLMDARASIVSNNLNVLMKSLTMITIAIMVPTFVVSAFSMNVSIPLQHNPFAFIIIMGLAAASVLSLLAIWRIKKL